MSDRQRAQTAFTMGNIGLWTQLCEQADVEDCACGYDDEDYATGRVGDLVGRPTWWQLARGRLLRWSVAAAIVLAYVNHWPGGQ